MTNPLDARAEILARIRSANGRDNSLESAKQEWERIPRQYRQQALLNPAACVELLAERLRDYGATVYACVPAELAVTIAGILQRRVKNKIATSPDIDPAWLARSGCEFFPDDTLSYAELDHCDGVLTGCKLAIAETGTLALCHASSGMDGPGQGRRAMTLIPDYHLCVVRTDAIVETVSEAMRWLERCARQPITLISGPSATADIEMTRIQGVHGPRVLDVVLCG